MVREHQGPHGSVPTIRYFDLTMVLDNETGRVTEFPPAAAQAAE
jgi:hypothetical protein